ncbi:MAG: FtsX-like permease family protein [Actinomycetota bacterium]
MTIIRLSLRGIRASLGRLILTAIAIVVGVGFVGAAFILADSLQDTFSEIFEQGASGTDAQITLADLEFGDDVRTIPDSLIATVAELPEVGDASGSVTIDPGDNFRPFIVVNAEGVPVEPLGPPIVTFSWDGEDQEGAITLAEGSAPSGVEETAIDVTYAETAGVSVGERITMLTPDGEQEFLLAGTFEIPITAGAFFVVFDFESAQTLYGKEGQVDAIALTRAPGVDVETMIAAVDDVIPPEAAVQSQEQVIDDASAEFETIINGFRTGLLIFALIALFVSLFIIYNTFQILINQRLQQIGMLRAIGATRNQISWQVVIEAFVIGLVSSAIGIGIGLGIAELIKLAFQAGGGFPETATVIRPRTIYVCLGVGVWATVKAALIPAIWAGRISPIAAMRNEAPQRSSRALRVVIGSVILALGLGLVALGLFGTSSLAGVGISLGAGAVLTFIGVAMLSVLFAGPVVNLFGRWSVLGGLLAALGAALLILMFTGDGLPGGIVGWIGFILKLIVSTIAIVTGLSIVVSGLTGRQTSFGGSASGLEGRLARQNAARSPQRTAATATALTIGIALVSTVGVVGESLKATFSDTLEQAIKADLFIFDEETQGPFSGELADRLEAEVDGLAALSRFRGNEIRIDGTDVEDIGAFEAATGEQLIDFTVTDGGVDGLVDDGVLVFVDAAEDRGLQVGDTIAVEFPDLETEQLTVSGIFEDASIFPFTNWIIDIGLYERHIENDDDVFVGALVAEGADAEAVKADVLEITGGFSSVTAQDTAEFQESQEGQVDQLITLLNYMLGLTLVVAFLGVINTIVLSVVERTREIGLLRAVGTTRKQIRSVIRWESVIVCLFGAVVGIILGVIFGAAAVAAIPDSIISVVAVPYESVLFMVLTAALAGVIAALFPALRASRLNVLEAISSTT